MGSGREPDLVHLEAKTVDGRKYIIFQILWYSGLPSYSCNHVISEWKSNFSVVIHLI